MAVINNIYLKNHIDIFWNKIYVVDKKLMEQEINIWRSYFFTIKINKSNWSDCSFIF